MFLYNRITGEDYIVGCSKDCHGAEGCHFILPHSCSDLRLSRLMHESYHGIFKRQILCGSFYLFCKYGEVSAFVNSRLCFVKYRLKPPDIKDGESLMLPMAKEYHLLVTVRSISCE